MARRKKKSPVDDRISVPIIRVSEQILPARLDLALDDVSMGTVLRRMDDDLQAVVVDTVGDFLGGTGDGVVIATLSDECRRRLADESSEPGMPAGEVDYRIAVIRPGEYQRWLVLTRVPDYVLVE